MGPYAKAIVVAISGAISTALIVATQGDVAEIPGLNESLISAIGTIVNVVLVYIVRNKPQ